MPSDPLLPQIIVQVVLIFINAFFSATEIALLSSNELMLQKQAEKGNKKANRLVKLLGAPTKFLATIQVGITLAGFLGSAFAADSFARRLTAILTGLDTSLSAGAIHSISLVVITLIISYFTLVFGELVPKRIAMKYPGEFAMAVANIVYHLSNLLKPIVSFLNFSTNVILRLFRINPDDIAERVTEEEIRAMIDAGSLGGTIEPEERAMIENIFEFNDKIVSEIMVHRSDVDLVWMDDDMDKWEETFVKSNHSVIAVCDADVDDVVGTLTLKNFYAAKRDGVTVLEDMRKYISKPEFIPEHVTINVLFKNMQLNKSHFLFVLDEYGGVSGIITINDLLEEIVGDFDLDDMDDPDIIVVSENLWRIRGKTPLYEISEITGVEFPSSDIDTISGYIVNELQAVPTEVHDLPDIVYKNLTMKVSEIGNRRVEWVILEKSEKAMVVFEDDVNEKASEVE